MKTGIPFSLKGAEFRYPSATENTLSTLDLEIRPGEWVAILGPNGSGKTTLMKMLNALLIPTQGICFVDGDNTSNSDFVIPIRSKVSMVFQNPEDQIVSAIVEEDVAFGPENIGLKPEIIRFRVKEALENAELWEKHKEPVSSLSGGQKQRLALAGAFAMQPKALLLDEALSMLDSYSKNEIIKLISEEHKKGMTIVQVTHRLDDILYADRVVVLESGKVVCDEPIFEFLSKSEEKLRSMKFKKPSVSILREILIKKKIISEEIKSDIYSIKEALCR